MKKYKGFFGTSSWWGKILGAFFGYLIGHAVGALIGILIGNAFDRGLMTHLNRPYNPFRDVKQQTAQKVFFEAVFSIMGYIAKSDGYVSVSEINMAESMMRDMRLSRSQQTLAKDCFKAGKQPDFDFAAMLNLLDSECSHHPELLKLFMDIQYRFAQIDGLTPAKTKALDALFLRMGFAPLHQQYRFYEDFGTSAFGGSSSTNNQRTQRPPPTSTLISNAYTLLNIKPTSTQAEIKKAYRRLISRHHPDKLMAQGLPESMIKLANDKTQQITKAYELICKDRGW